MKHYLSDVMESEIIEKAIQIRTFEEVLIESFQSLSLHGTVHTCLGQEMLSACLSVVLTKDDYVFTNHRNHGHVLAREDSPRKLFAEILGSSEGYLNGRGGSQHIHLQGSLLSSGTQGSLAPVAVGFAFGRKKMKQQAKTILLLGDGTFGEGVVYESLNIAALVQSPLFIIVENNQYAQSTPISKNTAGTIENRIGAFGIKYKYADSQDWKNLLTVLQDCLQFLEEQQKPIVLEIMTYRLSPHSKGDDFRDPSELQRARDKDPLLKILKLDSYQEIYKKYRSEFTILVHDLHKEIKTKPQFKVLIDKIEINYADVQTTESYFIRDHINQFFHSLLGRRSVFMVGEDLQDPYGGAFKLTKGLSAAYPSQVINMPISEAGIVGFSHGLGLNGMDCITEIMFGDFVTLAFEQIFSIGPKLKWMDIKNYNPPLIRTPMGGGLGYGPTHSQSLEFLFMNNDDLKCYFLNPFLPIANQYETALENKTPSVFFEHKRLYNYLFNPEKLDGFLVHKIGATNNCILTPHPATIDGILITFGHIATLVPEIIQEIFEKTDLVFSGLILGDLDFKTIFAILEKNNYQKIGVIEESYNACSLGAGIAKRLLESGFKGDFISIGAESVHLPAAPDLENNVLPTKNKIIQQLEHWLQEMEG